MGGKRLRWLLSAFLLGALATWLWVTFFRRRRSRRREERTASLELLVRSMPVAEPRAATEPEADIAPLETTASSPTAAAGPVPETLTAPAVLSPTELRSRDPEDETPFAAACPQHLSDVKGIGSVFESRLYEAGVGSFWELSQLSDADFARILRLTELQSHQMDLDAVRGDARRLATETKSKGRQWTRQAPDDFEPLTGIGPTFEKRLYDAGICTYEALANATVDLLEDVCHAPARFKPDYQSWIDQAKARVAARQA